MPISAGCIDEVVRPRHRVSGDLDCGGSVKRRRGLVVAHSYRPRREPFGLDDFMRDVQAACSNEPGQVRQVVGARNLEPTDREHRLDRLLNRLVGVETDDVIKLARIAGQQARGSTIRRALAEQQLRDLDFLRCRQARGPRAVRAQPSCRELQPDGEHEPDRRPRHRSEHRDPAARASGEPPL